MALSPAAADQLAREGMEALRQRDGAGARLRFERLIEEAPPAIPRPWLPLAQACRLADDPVGEARALQSLLKEQPRHLTGLLLMGDRKRLDGDDRAASSFFTAALNQAAVTRDVPTALHPLLRLLYIGAYVGNVPPLRGLCWASGLLCSGILYLEGLKAVLQQ